MRKTAVLLTGASLIAGLVTATPVAHAASGPALAADIAGSYQPLPPKRVLDTRSGIGGFKGLLAPGHTVTVNLFDARPVLANDVSAAVIDVTVPTPAPAGSLSVYPSSSGWDGRVTMSLTGGGNIQQQLTVPLSPSGGMTIRSNAAKPTHILIDVLGFYAAGAPTLPGRFAYANTRVLDTRKGIGVPKASIGAGKKVTLALAGHGGVPAGGASAVVADIAVLSAHTTGQLVVTDGDNTRATTPLRFVGDWERPQTMQTERVVKLGSNGTLTFTNTSASSIDLVVDVYGYFLPGTVTTEGSYVPQVPHALNSGQSIDIYSNAGFYRAVTGVPAGQTGAVNLVLTTDHPAQPAAISIRNVDTTAWNRAPQVSSSALLQPTELTVGQGPHSAVALYSMTNTEVLVHIYVTGYYLHVAG
ncbi:MAG TPA: hypothetical protein VGX49_15585 [Jatrophihabitans sp.]|jgi:hypothetical protein|nr:hypothetical protein [Jatrophihabitans sp.]